MDGEYWVLGSLVGHIGFPQSKDEEEDNTASERNDCQKSESVLYRYQASALTNLTATPWMGNASFLKCVNQRDGPADGENASSTIETLHAFFVRLAILDGW